MGGSGSGRGSGCGAAGANKLCKWQMPFGPATEFDIKYAGWTQDCWPKTELKTNYCGAAATAAEIDRRGLAHRPGLGAGPGAGAGEDLCTTRIPGDWQSELLPHSGTAFAVLAFNFCIPIPSIGPIPSRKHPHGIDAALTKDTPRLCPFCSLTASFSSAKIRNEIALIDEILQIAFTLLYIDGFSAHGQKKKHDMTTNFGPAS